MRKYLIYLFFLLIPLVYAIPECLREHPATEIPCYIISSWKPDTACNTHELYVYNSSGNLLHTSTFDNYPPVCNTTFNISTAGTYVYNSTIDDGIITVVQEDNMVGLGVIIFLLLLNGALFVLPFKVRFNKEEAHNNIIKKIMWTLAFTILIFNTTTFATLADNAGLGITHELFVFQWIFLKMLYVIIIFLFWNVFTSTLELWGVKRKKRPTGGDDEE